MATTALNNSQPSTSSERPAQIPPVAHNFNKLKDILHDGNVAPSPRSTCAELAHQHALEDLEKHLEHWSGKGDLAGSHDLPATNADLAPQAVLGKPEE